MMPRIRDKIRMDVFDAQMGIGNYKTILEEYGEVEGVMSDDTAGEVCELMNAPSRKTSRSLVRIGFLLGILEEDDTDE